MNSSGFTLVIWKPEGLQIHWSRTDEALKEYAIGLGLYNAEGEYTSDDKWLVFYGQMQDSSETI